MDCSMPSNHHILYLPLLLLPLIFPNIRVFSNESVLLIRWPKYWSFSFNISPSNEHPGLISFRMDWLDLLAVQGTLKSLLQHYINLKDNHLCDISFSSPLQPFPLTIFINTWKIYFCLKKNLCFCTGPSCRLSRQAPKRHNFNAVIWPGLKLHSLTHLAQWLHPFLHSYIFPLVLTLLYVGQKSGILCTIGFGVCLVCSYGSLSLNAWITDYSFLWA